MRPEIQFFAISLKREGAINISIFEVSGPVMIGSSSSHTAGAARLAWVARHIIGKPFHRVTFGLHGSFAKTYKGHGTDYALVADALGMHEDDEKLKDSFIWELGRNHRCIIQLLKC